jgi:hypothetical protein
MSNATVTMTPPANESSTTTILAIDLGKFKSVACRFDATTGKPLTPGGPATPARNQISYQ